MLRWPLESILFTPSAIYLCMHLSFYIYTIIRTKKEEGESVAEDDGALSIDPRTHQETSSSFPRDRSRSRLSISQQFQRGITVSMACCCLVGIAAWALALAGSSLLLLLHPWFAVHCRDALASLIAEQIGF